jgi:type III pantothenate kinase
LISFPISLFSYLFTPINSFFTMSFHRHLLVDVGNGYTKFALAEHHEIWDRFDCPTRDLTTDHLTQLLAPHHFSQITIASVVPSILTVFQQYRPNLLQIITNQSQLNLDIDYPNPQSIGTDRLVNAAALVHDHGAPGVVIDFGTAVTFDVINHLRAYCGGIIAPGLNLMTDYLHQRTALLPKVELCEPKQVLGRSTEEAILSGAAHGYRAMIHGLLEQLIQEQGLDDAVIVATGGDAGWIVSNMEDNIIVDEDLTLKGLLHLANLNPI